MEQGERRMTEEELENFNIPKSVLIKKCIQLEKQLTKKDKRIAELEAQIEELKEELAKVCNLKGCRRIKELEAQVERMKFDVKQLREDRMNDDTDQNIMDRLWEEWTINFGVSN